MSAGLAVLRVPQSAAALTASWLEISETTGLISKQRTSWAKRLWWRHGPYRMAQCMNANWWFMETWSHNEIAGGVFLGLFVCLCVCLWWIERLSFRDAGCNLCSGVECLTWVALDGIYGERSGELYQIRSPLRTFALSPDLHTLR